MKYCFIINPAAGRKSAEEDIRQKLSAFNGRYSYEVFISNKSSDTQAYVRQLRQTQEGPLRVISCGGDGTLNELVNAVQGLSDVSVGCYASGSGNDYAKYYGKKEEFLNLEKLFEAREEWVDLMRVGDRMAINMIDFGFDAKVAYGVERVRRWPIFGGRNAYATGVISALLGPMFTICTVTADGKKLGNNKMLLCTLGCGQFVGGGYRCAPKSNNSDGMMEVCFVKPLSRLRLVKLLSIYKRGLHLDDKSLRDIIVYQRAKVVHILSPHGMNILLDGEITPVKDVKVEIVPHSLLFAVPQGL